jgi:uncharacterized DUF497 family protein
MLVVVFDWDQNNLKKIQAHRIKMHEVEQALARDPILVYEQSADGEERYVYYGETDDSRLLAIVLTERDDKIRVITAYNFGCGAKARISGVARARKMTR